MPARGAALVLTVGLVVAGCSTTPVLDGQQVEADVRDRVEQTYDVEVDDVTCPVEVEVADGATFRCQVAVADETVAVTVTQTDEQGTVDVASTRAILVTATVEGDIAATLAERFARDDVEVTCEGPATRVEEPDATFACEAVDGDETKEVTVTVRDAKGALTYSLAEG